jgi:hypothetical protein
MGRTRVWSCGRGVLVLIRAPRSRPRGERRGLGEGVAGTGKVCVWGKAKRSGAGYACGAGRDEEDGGRTCTCSSDTATDWGNNMRGGVRTRSSAPNVRR